MKFNIQYFTHMAASKSNLHKIVWLTFKAAIFKVILQQLEQSGLTETFGIVVFEEINMVTNVDRTSLLPTVES